MSLQNAFEDLAVESKQDTIITSLGALLTELGTKLDENGTVSLSAATLAALESITVTVSNPTTNPETGLAKTVDVQAVRDRLPAALDADGGVKVHLQNTDEAGLTDVQLRATPVPVSGTVAATLSEPISVDDNGGSITVDGTFWQATQPISGTVTANLGTIAGVATQTTLAAILIELGDKLDENGTVSLSAATLAALETITVVVSGSVAVTGTFWQATQPVSGPLTDVQLRATPVPVSGTVVTGGLTDTQLRATPVPNSGTTELGVTSLAALETIQVGSLPAIPAGTNNIGDVDVVTMPAVALDVATLAALETIQIGSIAAGNNNIGDVDVASLPAIPAGNNNIGDVDIATVPAPLNVVGAGTEAAALRVTLANNSTGIVSLSAASLAALESVDLNAATLAALETIQIGSIAAGTNNIGDVDVLTLPAIPAGNNNIGDVDIASIAAGNNNIGDVDVASLPAENRPATATLANVSASVTSVTLRASAATRRGLMIVNESAADLYVKFGATASLTSYTVKMGPGSYYELPSPPYTGVVDGIWSAASGTARVTELT